MTNVRASVRINAYIQFWWVAANLLQCLQCIKMSEKFTHTTQTISQRNCNRFTDEYTLVIHLVDKFQEFKIANNNNRAHFNWIFWSNFAFVCVAFVCFAFVCVELVSVYFSIVDIRQIQWNYFWNRAKIHALHLISDAFLCNHFV